MIRTFVHLGLMLMTICFLPLTFAGEALKHDPFLRPLLSASLSNKAATDSAVAAKEVPWNPLLIAVMVSGKNSLVNLDGVIFRIGEEKDGYRFMQASDHEAIFKKGNKRIVLNMEVSTFRKNKERGGE